MDDDPRGVGSPRRPCGRRRRALRPVGPPAEGPAPSPVARDRAGCGWSGPAAPSLRLRTIRVRSTRLIWPFSSDTTTTTASVCSAIPRAARWRVPKRSAWTVVSASGRRAPAARIVSPRMITAPSWSGGPRREDRPEQVGRHVAVDHHPALGDLLETRSRVPARSAPRGHPPTGRRLPGRPRRRRDRRPANQPATAARRTSRPARCDPAPRRISGWKMTTRANRPTTAPPCRIRVSNSQAEGDCQDVDDDQDADADDQPDGTRPTDQAEQPVDQEGRDPDVDQRGQADLVQDRSERAPSSSGECSIATRRDRVIRRVAGRRVRAALVRRRRQPGERRRAGGPSRASQMRSRVPASPVRSASRASRTSLSVAITATPGRGTGPQGQVQVRIRRAAGQREVADVDGGGLRPGGPVAGRGLEGKREGGRPIAGIGGRLHHPGGDTGNEHRYAAPPRARAPARPRADGRPVQQAERRRHGSRPAASGDERCRRSASSRTVSRRPRDSARSSARQAVIGRIGQAAGRVEDDRQPVQRLGGADSIAGRDQQVGPPAKGRLVGRGPGRVPRRRRPARRRGAPAEPGPRRSPPTAGRGPGRVATPRRTRRGLRRDDRAGGNVAASQRVLVSLVERFTHGVSSHPTASCHGRTGATSPPLLPSAAGRWSRSAGGPAGRRDDANDLRARGFRRS